MTKAVGFWENQQFPVKAGFTSILCMVVVVGSGCLLAYLLGCLLTGPLGWRCGARDALLLLLL